MAILPLFDDPENYKVAFQRIKNLWEEGEVEFTPHAQDQMSQRGCETTDLQHIIKFGRIVGHSRPKVLWRYRIDGTTVDGVKAYCAVEIDRRLIIVTLVTMK